ncbi:MAG: ATP-binding protein [Kiritimatiellae bacterium]|nr:ATP-binding protein [Kiritimatiellia bacterium]MDD5523172.1 ATP-binding protein [Kiritimatiellia bacterium]
MRSPDDFSRTIRLEIPPDFVKDDIQRKQRGIEERIMPSSKLGTRTKEIAELSIEDADLKALFENLYDAALITDLTGRIIDANMRAVQYFQYTSQELAEGSIPDIIVGVDATVLQNICNNLVNDKFTLIQAHCTRKDGSYFPAEIASSRLHLSASEYLCFFIRDITTRREAEDEIKLARDELEQEVAERTKLNEGLNAEIAERKRAEEQLYAAILQLQQHDKAKSEFVSNVSHELKTPVASINYAAGNILKGITGPITEGAETYLHMIREDCARLIRTVEDILDMSRIEADTLKLNKVKINFARFTRRTVEALRIQVESAGMTMDIAIDNIIGFAEFDPEKIERVIFNVIKNAIKYNNPHGFVNVFLRYDETGFFVLDVVDSGIGIEKKYLGKVTERFFRIGEQVSGVGLGLAITKEILERHGGSIKLQSPPPGLDKGTIVSMHIPVSNPPSVLLIYEDEPNRLNMIKYLDDFGYNVTSVKRGEDILNAIGEVLPDLITVDWISPGMEGAITISTIRDQKALKSLPLIAILGEETDPVKQEILHGLALPLLQIPWQPEDLLNCLEQSVRGRVK